MLPPVRRLAEERPPKVPEGLRDLAGGHPDPALLPALVPPSRLSPGVRSHRSSPRLARLESAVREWIGADGVPVEQVTFAHGALDFVGRVLSAELRPRDAVAMEDPGYHHLLDLVAALGLRPVPVAVDGEGMRPAELRGALRAGVRAVVLSARAQNPLGGAFSPARRDARAEVLREAPEVLVLENDHASDVSSAPLARLVGRGRGAVPAGVGAGGADHHGGAPTAGGGAAGLGLRGRAERVRGHLRGLRRVRRACGRVVRRSRGGPGRRWSRG
ncbi:transcriptional regulator domain-containing protein [Streptomyces griseoluteus]|uniref:hypothetical protein n=1 Tax=Streptomyces griseoluteus TaxID=29306 RepID=UPI00381AAF78